METIANILASFDIFPLLLHALVISFKPVADAFSQMGAAMLPYLREMVVAQPGLLSGIIVMTLIYSLYAMVKRMRVSAISAVQQVTKGKD